MTDGTTSRVRHRCRLRERSRNRNNSCVVGLRPRALRSQLRTTGEPGSNTPTTGAKVVPVDGDVASEPDMDRAITAIKSDFGRLDGVVANAGINGVWVPIDDLTGRKGRHRPPQFAWNLPDAEQDGTADEGSWTGIDCGRCLDQWRASLHQSGSYDVECDNGGAGCDDTAARARARPLWHPH